MARFDLSEYEPVEDRLRKFWADHPEGRVLTDLVAYGDGQFIIRAEVYFDREDARPVATGFAEERVSDRGVNQTSALENGETSAIGRALANCDYAPKGKRPSREEMRKVDRVAAPAQVKREVTAEVVEDARAAIVAAVVTEELDVLRSLWMERGALLDVEVGMETGPTTLRQVINDRRKALEAAA